MNSYGPIICTTGYQRVNTSSSKEVSEESFCLISCLLLSGAETDELAF